MIENSTNDVSAIHVGDPLTPVEREMLALALFLICMKFGPVGFGTFESIAQKTGVLKEFVEKAESWIAHSK